MLNMEENIEFEVLGFAVRIKPENGEDVEAARSVVDFVCEEAEKIRLENPGLESGKIAVLLALKLAKDNLGLDKEYRENINLLQTTAVDALQIIEEVSQPST
jgi:hypothetical protein